jgi:hypothetical protein
MPRTVVFHRMAPAHDVATQLGVGGGAAADAEERGLCAAGVEQIEHGGGDIRIGAVVDGDGHFTPRYCGRWQPRQVGPEPLAARP